MWSDDNLKFHRVSVLTDRLKTHLQVHAPPLSVSVRLFLKAAQEVPGRSRKETSCLVSSGMFFFGFDFHDV